MESKRNRYIIFPGAVTGDLWHVAAAQILSSEYGDNSVHYVAVIVIANSQKDTNTLEDWKYGRITFDYLRTLGLDCMLVKMGDKYDKRTFEQTMYLQEEAWFDKTHSVQHQFSNLLFDELSTISATELHPDPVPWEGKAKVVLGGAKRVIALMNATTIAVGFLLDQKANLDRRRHGELAKRLSAPKGGAIDEGVLALGRAKYQQLKVMADKNPIILENYRVGHVNSQTDSSPALSGFLDRLVKATWQSQCKKITIASVNTKQAWDFLKPRAKANALLDLYNKGNEKGEWNDKNDWPGLDPRAQAYFWQLVANDPLIFGLFGGRSGSVDIAGFCGVRVYFWDEPWIEYGAGVDGTGLGPPYNGGLNDGEQPSGKSITKAYEQVPQCLRSLQLAAFMSIGLPAYTTKPTWEAVRNDDEKFTLWLKALRDEPRQDEHGPLTDRIFPACPKMDDWRMVNSMDEYRQGFLERNDLNILAHFLDVIGYRGAVAGKGFIAGNKNEKRF